VIPDFFSDDELDAASSWMAALQSAGNAAGALLASLVADTRIVASSIAASLAASCAFTAAHIRSLEAPRIELRPLRVNRAFADLFLSRAFVFLGFYTLLGYLFFFVHTAVAGATKEATGVLILIVTVSAAAGAIAAARLTARMDRRAVAFAGGAAFICALVAFLASRTLAQLGGSALLAGIAWGVFITADWALGCRFLPRHALATAMAVWNLALLAPQVLAPVIATALLTLLHQLQSASAPRTAFVAAICEVAIGIAWIWRLPASQRSVEPATSGNRPKALG
jgi:MFS family permease